MTKGDISSSTDGWNKRIESTWPFDWCNTVPRPGPHTDRVSICCRQLPPSPAIVTTTAANVWQSAYNRTWFCWRAVCHIKSNYSLEFTFPKFYSSCSCVGFSTGKCYSCFLAMIYWLDHNCLSLNPDITESIANSLYRHRGQLKVLMRLPHPATSIITQTSQGWKAFRYHCQQAVLQYSAVVLRHRAVRLIYTLMHWRGHRPLRRSPVSWSAQTRLLQFCSKPTSSEDIRENQSEHNPSARASFLVRFRSCHADFRGRRFSLIYRQVWTCL